MITIPHDHPPLSWRKSSRSQGEANTCVELTSDIDHVIVVRDSKDPEGPRLIFGRAAFRGLVEGLKRA